MGASAANLVVYGASGNSGSKIVTEALNRGHKLIGVSQEDFSVAFIDDVEHPQAIGKRIGIGC